MKNEYSGNIYRFALDFNRGYAYAEILDYTDISDFDGILLRVFKLIETEKVKSTTIHEIKRTGVLFGPAPVNKYPPATGRWTLYGKDDKFPKEPPLFKFLRGLLVKPNWAELTPWFKQNRFNDRADSVECNYEEVRYLETMILNHLDSIRAKITMMHIINEGESVSKYYDLGQLGLRNLYIQVVNTYYSKTNAESLLTEIS